MKVLDSGHKYALRSLDVPWWKFWKRYEILTFVKREGSNYPGNEGSYSGTTMQEVLRAVVQRLEYVDNQIPDAANKLAAQNIKEAIYHLEERAARRHGRVGVLSVDEAVYGKCCTKCNHTGCQGRCHT